jgi:DHA1 family multidrug resistance protein-like MFS transporter
MKTLKSLHRSVFLISLPFGILTFVLPILGKAIGADAVQIGLFFSAFSLMTVLMRPVVGVGLDRYGRRPFLLMGMVGYGLAMLVFAFSSEIWIITLARVFQGIASALFWLAVRAITADVAGADARGRSFGGIDQANSQGAILGAGIGYAVLISLNIDGGWKPLFAAYGLSGLAAALLAFRDVPETYTASQGSRVTPRTISWSRPWILLLLVTAVTGASWAMISPVLMIFLQEKLTTDVPSLAMAYLPAAIIWAVLPRQLGGLADRFGRKPMMILGLVAAAASSFIIPHLANLWGLAALWAFQALCYAAGDPAEAALVADLTGGDERGRAFGLYTMAAGLGATVGPLVGGWLYDGVGVRAPFYGNGLILALCTLVLAALLQVPPLERSAEPQ